MRKFCIILKFDYFLKKKVKKKIVYGFFIFIWQQLISLGRNQLEMQNKAQACLETKFEIIFILQSITFLFLCFFFLVF